MLKISRVTLLLSLLDVTWGTASENSGYFQKIRDFSFDMQMMHEYPERWYSYNSAVPLLSKVKVLPAIPESNGQLFLKQQLETPAWDVTYQVGIERS